MVEVLFAAGHVALPGVTPAVARSRSMHEARLEDALLRLDQLIEAPRQSETVISDTIFSILQAAGYAMGAREPAFPESRVRLDGIFTAELEGNTARVGCDVRGARGNASGQTIYRALELVRTGTLDRVLIISLGGYSKLARERARLERLGKIDLLDASDLRIWLQRRVALEQASKHSVTIILKQAFRALAARLAESPDEIYQIGWRNMEELLGEVFTRLGFDTEVTPSAQAGGFDIRLADLTSLVYLVEVKHWATPVGSGVVKRLVEVTARESAKAGLILGTGGFAPSLFDGVIELQTAPIHMGGRDKITSLCRAFYRSETQLWQVDTDLAPLLFAGTTAVPVKG